MGRSHSPYTCGIYRLDWGKKGDYIGSAIYIPKRLARHRRYLRQKRHGNEKMQKLFNKYGMFDYSIVLICRPRDLLLYEQMVIEALKPTLNKTDETRAPWQGKHLSRTHKAKLATRARKPRVRI